MLRTIALLLIAALPCGCGTVYLQAPEGSKVRLLRKDEPVSVVHEEKIWFALYGNEPMSDNDMAVLLERLGLKEARFVLEATFWDSVISTFTWVVTINRQTVIIEGNR